MNQLFRTTAAAMFVVVCLSGDFTTAQDINAMPPVVVQTVPESGVKDVAPGEVEIRVTFSKSMANGSWSWSTAWQDSSPQAIGKPKYDRDQKTCVLKVKLEPNKTYGYWVNSERFQGFRDRQGHPAVPYLLVFRTKGN
ncbi:MAG: Ig-like domain-containing protein [Thermoguttaceae bacterium]